MSPEDAVRLAARAALDKKARDVVLLDLRDQASFTDFFLIVSGTNQKQLVAMCDAILKGLREEGIRPDHVEGYPRQQWMLLDFSSFIVHAFTETTRRFYDLERLWGEAARHELSP